MEKLNIDSLELLQKRRSKKWRTHPADVLPLFVAEMDLPVAEPIKRTLHEMIDASDLGYSSVVPELAHAFNKFAGRNWNWNIDPDQFQLATDVAIASIQVLGKFTNPGDKIGLSSPTYNDIINWITGVSGEPVDIPLSRDAEGAWSLDLAGIEEAFAAGVRAYILCNPQNPVGYVPSRLELAHLADLADEYGVLVLSDEIHSPLVFARSTFTPYLSINEQAKRTGVAITSASKAWNLAGLKCAQIITADESRAQAIKTLPESMAMGSSLLGAWASVAAYNEGEDWLAKTLDLLDENRKLVQRLLEEHLPQAKYRIPDATYLAWIDLSAYQPVNPAAHILEFARVAFSEGIIFGPTGAGHVRLNFATSPEIITEAITRMASAFAK
ncbi:MAG: aminotransferase class I/II-fold pyridoxal phosphate-dependent enzyme [Actinobacteria bacterium]|nr:aminotransferase class I/II-fold pyridoxal phosphate-dependent enzyme [Actinomycetota bacterium]